MGSDPVPGMFPDAPSYDVHRRVVETYARDLPSGNSLLDALARRTSRGGRKAEFEFTATPYNFCEVLCVASPETAVALLDAGITTADEAVAFLEEHGLDDLVEDNHDAAEAALRWAAMPSEVLDRFQHSPLSFMRTRRASGRSWGRTCSASSGGTRRSGPPCRSAGSICETSSRSASRGSSTPRTTRVP